MTVCVSGLFSILCVSEADCSPSEDTDHIHKTSKIIPETLKIDHWRQKLILFPPALVVCLNSAQSEMTPELFKTTSRTRKPQFNSA